MGLVLLDNRVLGIPQLLTPPLDPTNTETWTIGMINLLRQLIILQLLDQPTMPTRLKDRTPLTHLELLMAPIILTRRISLVLARLLIKPHPAHLVMHQLQVLARGYLSIHLQDWPRVIRHHLL